MKLARLLLILMAMGSGLFVKAPSHAAAKAEVDTCFCDSNCLRHGDCCWYCGGT